jgi:hypothetical protein
MEVTGPNRHSKGNGPGLSAEGFINIGLNWSDD